MDVRPDLSLCLVTENHRDLLRRCLLSLHATADPVSFEAIVVDNNSGDDTVDLLLREFPGVKVFENSVAEPFAPAANRALRLATGRYAALCADDLTLQPECLKRLLAFLDETPDAGLAAPQILDRERSTTCNAGEFPGLACLLGRQSVNPPPTQDAWLTATFLVIRREVLEEVGLLDEGYTGDGADLDFCWRASKAGWHLHRRPEAEAVLLLDAQRQPDPASLSRQGLFRFLRKKWLGGKSLY